MSFFGDADELVIDWSLGQPRARRSYGDHPYVQAFQRKPLFSVRDLVGGVARVVFAPPTQPLPTTIADVLDLATNEPVGGWIEFGATR